MGTFIHIPTFLPSEWFGILWPDFPFSLITHLVRMYVYEITHFNAIPYMPYILHISIFIYLSLLCDSGTTYHNYYLSITNEIDWLTIAYLGPLHIHSDRLGCGVTKWCYIRSHTHNPIGQYTLPDSLGLLWLICNI